MRLSRLRRQHIQLGRLQALCVHMCKAPGSWEVGRVWPQAGLLGHGAIAAGCMRACRWRTLTTLMAGVSTPSLMIMVAASSTTTSRIPCRMWLCWKAAAREGNVCGAGPGQPHNQ